MASTGLAVLSGLFIWLILVGLSIFVFAVAFIVLVSIRSAKLKNLEAAVMEPNLRTTEEYLGKMQSLVAEVWTKRATNHPIPPLKHVAKGFLLTEDGEKSIRNEICSSLHTIEERATEFDQSYTRQRSMTANEYLHWLSEQEGLQIPIDAIDNYLNFFNTARYDSHTLEFSEEDFTFFNSQYNKILDGIPPPPDQAPLKPATTLLQRRQKSWNQ